MKNLILLSALLTVTSMSFFSCDKIRNKNANEYINENLQLPSGSFRVSDNELQSTDDIQVTSSSSGNGTMLIGGGEVINASISFNAANSNVTHAGIRFGDDGDTWLIPINGANGNSNGTLDFSMQLPDGLCEQLSSICHDIKCYEFAVAEGTNGTSYQISSANINELASACGDCDDPSCQGVVDPSACLPWATGFGNFTYKGETNSLNTMTNSLGLYLMNLSDNIGTELASIYFDGYSGQPGTFSISSGGLVGGQEVSYITSGSATVSDIGGGKYFVRFNGNAEDINGDISPFSGSFTGTFLF